jgi:hypothetical protein
MSRFIPAIIAAIGMSTMAGCVAESGDMSEEFVSQDSELACDNREGTNAMIAALMNTMAQELGRWEVLTDFKVVRGYNYQAQLAFSDAGNAKCGGTSGCPLTRALLLHQDSRTDQTVTFPGNVKLSAWSFASRLTTGYDVQKACKSGGWCPYEPHKLTPQGDPVPGGCDTLFTYKAEKTTGGNLNNAANLKNALKFTEGNGPNPYVGFSSTASTVTVDPSGGMGDDPSNTTESGSAAGCNAVADAAGTIPISVNGVIQQVTALNYPCICAGVNATAPQTTKLKNDKPLTPKTYYCRVSN